MQFASVIGHDQLKNNLIKQVKNNRVAHAQMFLGKEGSGNFQLALAFAQYINCEQKSDTDSCGTCNNCRKYESIQHPDLNFVFPTAIGPGVKEKPDSKKYFGQWREFLLEHHYFDLTAWCKFIEVEKKQPIINKQDSELINQALTLKSFEAPYKVVIVWWPEKMNIECANKILKTLEEPLGKSLLLMVGHQTEELLPTILSRVQISTLGELREEAVANSLVNEFEISPELALSCARLSEGSYYQATTLAQNPDKDEKIILQFQTWMRLCYKLEIPNLNQWVEDMAKNGREQQKTFILYCLRMFRNCTIANYADPSLEKVHHLEAGFIKNFSKFIHGGNIIDFMQEFDDAHHAISRNGNGKIIFMSLSLKVCNLLRYKA